MKKSLILRISDKKSKIRILLVSHDMGIICKSLDIAPVLGDFMLLSLEHGKIKEIFFKIPKPFEVLPADVIKIYNVDLLPITTLNGLECNQLIASSSEIVYQNFFTKIITHDTFSKF